MSNGKRRGDSCEDMDKISELPDGVLLKVLSFLPTKVAASTSILSKRWEFLWMWLTKLEYDYSCYSVSERERLREFISLNLPLHKAPVIETFHLKSSLGPAGSIYPKDIILWVQIAVSRNVRDLSLKFFSFEERVTEMPSNLYISKSIVILKLKDDIHVKVPRMVCLPSLKTLCLGRVTYSDENSLHKLVSNCPVLEDLVVERNNLDNLVKLSISAKSLQRLTLKMYTPCHLDGIMLNTPCLKYLKVIDERQESDSENESDSDSPRYAYEFKDMPKLEEADFELTFQNMKKFFGTITSVKRLSLCLGVYVEMAQYYEGVVFKQLEHLKLCSCDSDWPIIVARLLKDSPNLRALEVHPIDDHPDRRVNLPNHWDDQLNGVVPYSLLRSLETFKCTGMYGVQNEMGFAKYILRNARCLKTATFSFQPSYIVPETTAMKIQDLSLSVRASATCQLMFD